MLLVVSYLAYIFYPLKLISFDQVDILSSPTYLLRLLRERDAVLLPKENSGVPGARDTRPVPQGMESRIPTLFADVNDQLRQNPKNRIIIGERSNVSGKDPNQMIKLTTVSSFILLSES